MKRPITVIVSVMLLGMSSLGGFISIIHDAQLQSSRLISDIILEGWLILSLVLLLVVPLWGEATVSGRLVAWRYKTSGGAHCARMGRPGLPVSIKTIPWAKNRAPIQTLLNRAKNAPGGPGDMARWKATGAPPCAFKALRAQISLFHTPARPHGRLFLSFIIFSCRLLPASSPSSGHVPCF